MVKNWIHAAIKNKGALHAVLGVPMGKTIPKAKLGGATQSKNPHVKKLANLAITLGKIKTGKSPLGFK